MNHADVQAWVAGYERLWRRAGTERLGELFTPDAAYVPSPWSRVVEGVKQLADFWESERSGPDEEFTMSCEVVAVDGLTAVVRVYVEYGGEDPRSWRNLWILRFADDGRCSAFEEWPFAPNQPDGHE
jgi:ketosteroid isomerase-like protein